MSPKQLKISKEFKHKKVVKDSASKLIPDTEKLIPDTEKLIPDTETLRDAENTGTATDTATQTTGTATDTATQTAGTDTAATQTTATTLKGWAQEKGIKVLDSVTIELSNQTHSTGIFLLEDTSAKVAITVPKETFISRRNVASMPDLQFISLQKSWSDATVLKCYFLHLKHHCPDSPYLKALPKEVDRPITWDRQSVEYQVLVATCGYEGLLDDKMHLLQEEYEKIKEKVANTKLENITFQDFIWADHVVISRSMDLNEGLVVVPVIDFANHSFTPNAFWIETKDGMDLIIHENSNVEPGEEIFISYSTKSNDQLLLTYGFTLAGNPNQSIMLPPPCEFLLEQSCWVPEKFIEFCGRKGDLMDRWGSTDLQFINPPSQAQEGESLNCTRNILSDKYLAVIFLCALDDPTCIPDSVITPNPHDFLNWHKSKLDKTMHLVSQLRAFSGMVHIIEPEIESYSLELEDDIERNQRVEYVEILRKDTLDTLVQAKNVFEALIEGFLEMDLVQQYLQSE